METQYSVEFFMSFVENIQKLCQQYLVFSQFVEVSGYVSVEIDNMKKERYVLSELLQSSGNVLSESYCTKCFKTSEIDVCQPLATRDTNFLKRKGNNLNSQCHTAPDSQAVFPARVKLESMMLPVISAPEEQPVGEGTDCLDRVQIIEPRSLVQDQSVDQFNIQKPVNPVASCSEVASNMCPQTVQSRRKRRKPSAHTESTFLRSPASTSNLSYSSESLGGESPSQTGCLQGEVSVSLPWTVYDDSDLSCYQASYQANPVSLEASDLNTLDTELNQSKTNMSCEDEGCSESDFNTSMSLFYSQNQKKVDNPGSLSVLRSVLKRFKHFHYDKSGKDVEPLDTPPEELNELLLDFFKNAKKVDGSELTAGSLKNTQVYMARYLRQNGYPYSITRDNRFRTSREYIKSRLDELGTLKTLPRHVPLTDEHLEIMFNKRILGEDSPETVVNAMWIMNSKYLATRKPADHFNLKWGDLNLVVDSAQQYVERPINKSFSLKVFAKPDDPARCFVNLYKKYRDMRPKNCLDGDSAFYLKIHSAPGSNSCYLPTPMMWSPLSYMWRKILVAAGLSLHTKIV